MGEAYYWVRTSSTPNGGQGAGLPHLPRGPWVNLPYGKLGLASNPPDSGLRASGSEPGMAKANSARTSPTDLDLDPNGHYPRASLSLPNML